MVPWIAVLLGCRVDEIEPLNLDSGSAPEPEPEPEDPDRSLLENEVRRLVNEVRSAGTTCGDLVMAGGQPALASDGLLRIVARAHSKDMAERGFFDHVNPDGDDPADRIAAAGFEGALPWGENIAAGTDDPELVIDGWIASPGHCENIMRPDYLVIGVGTFGDGSETYWTQEFAGSHGPSVTAR